MHILEIPSYFLPLGGAFCLEQAVALRGRGHRVHILACNQLGLRLGVADYLFSRWGIWEERRNGVLVVRANMRALPKSVQGNQRRWVQRVWYLYQYYCRKYGKPDVIHAHCCLWGGVAAAYISEREGIPFFITEHTPVQLYEHDFGEGWTRHLWARQLLKQTFEHANCVIPVSSELVDWLEPFFGRDYRCHWISNIIDVEHFAYRQRKVSRRCVCCLAVADIYRKGYDVLAEAWAQMPQNTTLLIAGRGTRSAAMKRLFEHYQNVILMGELDKDSVVDVLYKSNVLVLPARSEAQPLVLLEAMCTGIPVVTTDAVPECVRVPDACRTVHAGDAVSLAEQMRLALVEDRLTEDASKRIREMVSPDAVARQLEALFAESVPV